MLTLRHFWVAFSIAFCVLALSTPQSFAGVGPENLIVVVNADSDDSKTIANHYVELRKIPSSNVIFLSDIPKQPVTNLEAFREKILKPLLAEIDARGLASQVRAVAYSAGFPYAVNVKEHRERIEDPQLKKYFTPVASINGLTYFYRFVLADSEQYLSPFANLYARMSWSRNYSNPFNGELGDRFDKANQFASEGKHGEAASEYLALFTEQPHQAPLPILAARSFVKADRLEDAMKALADAVRAGWTSALDLEKDEQLAPLTSRDDFKSLVKGLSDAPTIMQHPLAFEASRQWTRNGWWTNSAENGIAYLPSFVLAFTAGEGTTVDEAIDYLTIAARADNSFPEGKIYITTTSDTRSRARKNQFPETMLLLKGLGIETELVKAAVPKNKTDVLGVTMGTASFDWPASGSQFVPGALADNLTSTGAVMHAKGQTKMTKFLVAGAAAASGTVTEPYVANESEWQVKFPLPQLHAYYLQGYSAIEAFYLATSSPYQLLIVGDPLCQPFAKQPAELIAGQRTKIDGAETLVLQPVVPKPDSPQAIASEKTSPLSEVEIYLDGKLAQRSPVVNQYRIRLADLPGGAYELRAVMVGEPHTAPRKTILTWLNVPGILAAPTATVVADETSAADQPSAPENPPASTASEEKNDLHDELFGDEAGKEGNTGTTRSATLQLAATGADSITLRYFNQVVATYKGDAGEIRVDLQSLGSGPIRLRPYADYRGTIIPGREIVIAE